MPILTGENLTGLEHMRVSSNHHIHSAFQKDLCPFLLKLINLLCVFAAPVGKYNHKISFLPGRLNILPDFCFVLQ